MAELCDEEFQHIVSASDEYAVIDEIASIRITYQIVPISGKGMVVLKNPELHPNIKSSDSIKD
jgi:hypothetical protein